MTRCFEMRINFEGTHCASCCVWSALDGINMEYVSRTLAIWIGCVALYTSFYKEFIWGKDFFLFFFFYIKNNFSAAQAGNSHQPIHPMCPSEIFFLLLKDVEFSHEIFVWNENGGKKWCLKILLRIIPIEIYYEELLSRWIFKNDR